MSFDLAIQTAVWKFLTGDAGITDLVPEDNILDRNERPNPDPSIVVGEGQIVDEGDTLNRRRQRCYLDLHIWKREASLTGCKEIAGAIRAAVRVGKFTDPAVHFAGCHIQSTRFMRDPNGETSHGVVVLNMLAEDLS